MEVAAEEVADPVFESLADPNHERKAPQIRKVDQQRRKSSFSVAASTDLAPMAQGGGQSSREPCWYCNGRHFIVVCPMFKAMKVKDRIGLVRSKGRCMSCYDQGHMVKDCPQSVVCGIDGCNFKHSRYLHLNKEEAPRAMNAPAGTTVGPQFPQTTSGTVSRPTPRTTSSSMGRNSTVSCSFTTAKEVKVALPVVPVPVRCPTSQTSVITYALLDPGSTATFCSSSLVERLAATQQNETLNLRTLSGEETVETTYINLQASDLDGQLSVNLKKVYVRPHMSVGLSSLVSREDLKRWQHLEEIEIPNINTEEVHLLISNDVPQALMPLEICSGRPGEPYAVKTVFGWSINGPVGQGPQMTVSYFVDLNLSNKVERFWKLDNPAGLEDWTLSVCDRKVMSHWEDSLQREGSHYTLGIPFKHQPLHLPIHLNTSRYTYQSI